MRGAKRKVSIKKPYIPYVSILLVSLGLSACVYNGANEQKHQGYLISNQVFNNQNQSFISHQGDGRFSSYLTQNINYAPVKALTTSLDTNLPFTLINRGEAHITVITPVEYFDQLKEVVTMAQIEKIALAANIQAAKFTPVCIGEGKVNQEDKMLYTYFVVVESEALFAIRRQVYQLFVDGGGDKNAFDPEVFYPHITLGFNQRDLHLSDGVVKDKRSCKYALEVAN